MNVQELSNQAVFEYFSHRTYSIGNMIFIGKGPAKVDPLLILRDTLRLNGKTYFGTSMGSEFIKQPVSQKSFQLIIPDSLAYKYSYLVDSTDYERDYAMIYLFSPLLVTDTPNIFMMQYHSWNNSCFDDSCLRYLQRGFLKFHFEYGKIRYIEEVSLLNNPSFSSFGFFSKAQMEKALLGEKIKWNSIIETTFEYNWTDPPTKN